MELRGINGGDEDGLKTNQSKQTNYRDMPEEDTLPPAPIFHFFCASLRQRDREKRGKKGKKESERASERGSE